MSADSMGGSDESLLERFNGGDAGAFEILLSRYRVPIFNFILRSVRDRHKAEDLMQEVFLRIVRRSKDFKGESKFSTWTYAIARNICIDESRKAKHRRHRSLDVGSRRGDGESAPLVERVASNSHGADRSATSRKLRGEIAEAVELLPEDQREVFLLRQVQGMPFKEIADLVGVPENTVKSRMRYALERLREALIEYEDYARQMR